jgi:G:T/U-mismatch repair DNA glycosylase
MALEALQLRCIIRRWPLWRKSAGWPGRGFAHFATLVLPSSSPANAMLSFDQKLRLWRDILP